MPALGRAALQTDLAYLKIQHWRLKKRMNPHFGSNPLELLNNSQETKQDQHVKFGEK